MDDPNTSKKNMPKKIKKPTVNLEGIEKEYHGVGLFFSGGTEQEINQVIPFLRKKYENDDSALDFLIFLNKKE